MVYLWWNNEFGTWNVCIHFHSEGCSFKHSSKPTPVSHLEPMTHGPRNLMSTSYKLTLKLRILNGCCYLGTFNTSDSNNGAKLFQADSRLGAAPRSRLPGIYSFVYRLRGVPWAASGTGSHDANLTIWLLSPGFPNAPDIVKIWNVCKCLKWDGPTWPNHCQTISFSGCWVLVFRSSQVRRLVRRFLGTHWAADHPAAARPDRWKASHVIAKVYEDARGIHTTIEKRQIDYWSISTHTHIYII